MQHGIAPLLYVALRDSGALEAQPPDVRRALARIAREQSLIETVRRADLMRLLEELTTAGIRPLVFKGAALAYTHYPEPWMRPRVDVDLLIRESDAAAAAGTFERMGYTRSARPTGEHVTHQFTYLGRSGGVETAYDVHWRLSDPQVFANVFRFDELDGEAVPIAALPHAMALGPIHALLAGCVHRIAHHYDDDNLIRLYDLDRLARRLREADWDRVAAIATEKRIRAVCRRGLELTVHCFDTPVPDRVWAMLVAGDLEPSAAYIDDRLRKVDILRSDLGALSTWRARLGLLTEHLFPSAEYMLATTGASHRVWLPALYAYRIARGAGRWFRPLR